jgi:hypothetical protein
MSCDYKVSLSRVFLMCILFDILITNY